MSLSRPLWKWDTWMMHIIVCCPSWQLQSHQFTSKHISTVSATTDTLETNSDWCYRCKRPFLPILISLWSLQSVGTLSGVMAILFDTGIVIVTILKTLTISRLRKGVKALGKQSLVGLLIKQGVQISLLLVGILLNLNKVWSDMGNSACLPLWMCLTTVQIYAYCDAH